MKNKGKIILTAITILLMIFLTWFLWRSVARSRSRLSQEELSYKQAVADSIQEQLWHLKKQLITRKTAHDTYPDNDLGLAILDDYCVIDEVLFETSGDDDHAWIGYVLFKNRVSDEDDFSVNYRRYPFIGWYALNGPFPKINTDNHYTYRGEYTLVSGDDVMFLLNDNIPVDPFMLLPYLYENRRAAPMSSFDFSLVNQDTDSKYSVGVDEGIYVYSTAGQYYSRECKRLEKKIRESKNLILIIMLAFHIPIVLYLLQIWRSSRPSLGGYIFVVIFYYLLVSTLAPALAASRIARRFTNTRMPDVVQTQKEMLQSYHQKHIITDATCDKQMELLALKVYNPDH